jgi:hypothetical protein
MAHTPPAAKDSEQIDLLRITAHEMESLHPQIEAMGACVPVEVMPLHDLQAALG